MSDALSGCRELAAYARLIDGDARAWITALRIFGHCPSLTLAVSSPRRMMGSLSSLAVDSGQICHIVARQAFRLSGIKSDRTGLLMVRSGRIRIDAGGCLQARAGDLVVLGPALKMVMTAPATADAMIVQWPADQALVPAAGLYRTAWAEPLLAGYLSRSRFFRDHCDAIEVTEHFLQRLQRALQDPARAPVPAPPAPEDERVRRAVRFLHSHPRWRFDLPTLASVAAASERNLYYLMKAQTGMTPYRFYQRCRLIRLRQSLLRCHCDNPSIAWHAMDEGFSHLGRFASLYREHFGELPSDTLVWRARLRNQCEVLTAGSVQRLTAA